MNEQIDRPLLAVTPQTAPFIGAGVEVLQQATAAGLGALVGAGINAMRGQSAGGGAKAGALVGLVVGLIASSAMNTTAAAKIAQHEAQKSAGQTG